jgi:LysM repeat protein
MLGIAVRYRVDYQALLDANDISDVNLLYVGQVLTIPDSPPLPGADDRTHIVQAGESILSVAAEHGVDYDLLLEVNQISDPDLIYEGQVLIIPAE